MNARGIYYARLSSLIVSVAWIRINGSTDPAERRTNVSRIYQTWHVYENEGRFVR